MTTTIRNQKAVGSPRVVALDVLRGIAIIGTLATNIWIFALAGQASSVAVESEVNPSLFTQLTNLVTDGKWIGLLTIMFGIGLEIQRQSAIRRGQKWPGRYPWRAALLILDGLLNYFFIFEFDVLMGYGLTALVVAAVLARGEKAQKIWMWVCVSLHLVAHLGVAIVFLLLNSGDESAYEQLAEDYEQPPVDSYLAGVVYRFTNFFNGRMEIPIMFLMGLGLFLVGARLYRAGIFEPEGKRIRRITMLLSFGIGLPIDWGLRLFGPEEFGSVTRYVTSAMVSFGVLALVATWYANRNRTGPVGSFFTVIGRTALSCYVLQNLLASIVFYDWGFGLSRKLSEENQDWVTVIAWALLSLTLFGFAWLCLRFFGRGPLEALWQVSFKGINAALDRRASRRAERRALKGGDAATSKEKSTAVSTDSAAAAATAER